MPTDREKQREIHNTTNRREIHSIETSMGRQFGVHQKKDNAASVELSVCVCVCVCVYGDEV